MAKSFCPLGLIAIHKVFINTSLPREVYRPCLAVRLRSGAVIVPAGAVIVPVHFESLMVEVTISARPVGADIWRMNPRRRTFRAAQPSYAQVTYALAQGQFGPVGCPEVIISK